MDDKYKTLRWRNKGRRRQDTRTRAFRVQLFRGVVSREVVSWQGAAGRVKRQGRGGVMACRGDGLNIKLGYHTGIGDLTYGAREEKEQEEEERMQGYSRLALWPLLGGRCVTGRRRRRGEGGDAWVGLNFRGTITRGVFLG